MADKRKLLKDADEAYSELMEAVAGLSELEMSRVWLGTWGAREILIHIAAWDREMIPALQRVGRGEPPYAAGAYDDGDGWNARFVEARLGANVPGILAELAANHAAFVAAAAALPEETYIAVGPATWCRASPRIITASMRGRSGAGARRRRSTRKRGTGSRPGGTRRRAVGRSARGAVSRRGCSGV
jgi:hypothetical protein